MRKIQKSGGKQKSIPGGWDSPEVSKNWASWRELGECAWNGEQERLREAEMRRKEPPLCSDNTGKLLDGSRQGSSVIRFLLKTRCSVENGARIKAQTI